MDQLRQTASKIKNPAISHVKKIYVEKYSLSWFGNFAFYHFLTASLEHEILFFGYSTYLEDLLWSHCSPFLPDSLKLFNNHCRS